MKLTDKNVQGLINLAKKNPQVLAVGLFGSFARGEKYRDIDVCIFLKPSNYLPKNLSRLRFHYTLSNEKYDVQVFQQLPIYIRKRILKDAKILYCRDMDLLYDLYFMTLRQFEDYRPYYEKYLEGILYAG